MARHYAKNPATTVSDGLLEQARARAEAAAARLREVEHGDPASASWPAEYEAASAAARAASRRVDALEQLHAAQVERGGQRAAAVKAHAADLKAIEAGLARPVTRWPPPPSEHLGRYGRAGHGCRRRITHCWPRAARGRLGGPAGG